MSGHHVSTGHKVVEYSALEAMTKRCEKAEEDYHFYHREWESACERWNYSQECLAAMTKDRDAWKLMACRLVETSKLCIEGWWGDTKQMESVIAEFADMVKERG